MRDTSKDTDRISRIWRWVHNNLPGEPRDSSDVDATVIRILREQQAEIEHLRAAVPALLAGHPGKIARGMVDDLRDAAIDLRLTTGRGSEFWQPDAIPEKLALAARLDGWAAVLAALLPPEVDPHAE